MAREEARMSFWDHLEELRGSLLRMLAAALLAVVVAFALKDPLFRLVLAPSQPDFCTYRWLGLAPLSVHLVNTQLSEQFMVHARVSLVSGVLLASPYLLRVLYGFISPALYARERACSVRVVVASYAMFFVGLVANYLLFFPLTLRFLATYSVSASVGNLLSLSSYVDTLLMLSLLFGLVFELPVVSGLLAWFGLLRAAWMRRYRRHAIVAILIAAAFITPTTDALTLLIVSLPVWALYELSILIVRSVAPPPDDAP